MFFFSRHLVLPFYSYSDNYASPLHSGLHKLLLSHSYYYYQYVSEAVAMTTKLVSLRLYQTPAIYLFGSWPCMAVRQLVVPETGIIPPFFACVWGD